MNHRPIRVFGLSSLLVAAAGCGTHSDTEPVRRSEAAVLGTDTFLYLQCNATSWDANAESRLVETAPGSGLFTLSYEIDVDWLVTSPDSCSIVETNQLDGWGTTQQRYAFRSGQSTLVVVPDARALTPSQSSFFQVRYPAKGQYTALVNWHNGTFLISEAAAGASVEPQRSLIERNEAALTQFDVAQTLTSIATNGGVAGGAVWHDAMFKTQARMASFPGEPGPFCDSNGFPGRVNDFIVGCAGTAAPLVGHLDKWEGLAVANRFDLAPEGGENCGEARASFYVPPGLITQPERSFLIFESVVPNPEPELGLDGCRAVQAFWASLSDIDDPAARGAKLAEAFYTGEASLTAAGFKPFFSFENFGPGKGRVRSLVFGGIANWDFREFHLLAGGGVTAIPVAQSLTPIAIAPFDPVLGTHPKNAQCRQDLLDTVDTLLTDDLNAMGIDVSPACFDGQSSNFRARLEDAIEFPGQEDLAAALVARANEISPGINLSAVQIAARAQFVGTCIGCHHRPDLPESRDFGHGLTAPSPIIPPGESQDDIDFTQVNNLEEEPCAASGPDAQETCFKLSPLLGGIFLPHRKTVLDAYLNTPVGSFEPPAPGETSTHTIGGTPNARTH